MDEGDDITAFSNSDHAYVIELSEEAWASLQERMNDPTPPPTEKMIEAFRRSREGRKSWDG